MSRCVRILSVLFVFTALLSVTVPGSAQTEAERLAARAAAQAGDKAMKEGRFEEALDYFLKAEATHHAPTLVVRIARAHTQLGQFVKAREAYLLVKREVLDSASPAAFKKAQAEANAELPVVEAKIAKVTLLIEGPPVQDVRLILDEQLLPNAALGLPYPIDPGTHTVRAEAAGFEPVDTEFGIESGATTSVNLELQALPEQQQSLPPPSTPSVASAASPSPDATEPDRAPPQTNWLRVGAYAGLGLGVAGVGVGAYFSWQQGNHDQDADDEYKACLLQSGGDSCRDTSRAERVFELEDDAETAHRYAIVSYVVGGVAVAGGLILYFLSDDGDSSQTAWSPYFDGQQWGVVGEF